MKDTLTRLTTLGFMLALTLSLATVYSFHSPSEASFSTSSFINKYNNNVPLSPIEKEKLQVNGKVKNVKGNSLDSVFVIISDSTGKVNLDTIITDKKGKFEFELEYNNEYRVYYVAEGYIKSYDLFKTKVPNYKLGKKLYAPALAPILFKEDANVNKRALERNPLYVVYFDGSLDEFNFDVKNVASFLDEIIKPNVGEMSVSGVFKDTLIDEFRVRIVAEDTLGFLLGETTSNSDGTYSIVVPLMNKVKLKFISEDHYESFAEVNTKVVPESNSNNDYKVSQNFNLVNKIDSTVNKDAFDEPIARIEHLKETDGFVANPAVEKHFENELMVDHKRIQLTGLLTTTDQTPMYGTVVTVRNGDVLVEEIVFDSNSYKVNLPYQSIVHVRFKTNGYHDTYVSYNTNMDIDEMDNMQKVNTNIDLVSRDRSEINPKAFKFPMSKYNYDASSKSFLSDINISSDFLAILNSPPPPPDTAITTTFVTMRGTVMDPTGGKKVPNATIRVLNEGRVLVSSYSADKKGRYGVTLGLNKIYYLEVEQEGYLATQTKVNTHVPEGVEKNNLEDQYGQNLEILAPDMEITNPKDGKPYGVRQEMLEQNAAMAYFYNDSTKEFEEDPAVFDQFSEAIIAYKEPVEKEIPAATLAEVEEANRLETERLESERNRVKIPDLRLAGKIVDERNLPLLGATVALYEGKKLVSEVKTDSLGNYNMVLPTQKLLTMKVEGNNLYLVTAEINTSYPDSLEPKSEILDMPDLKTYTKSNAGINPIAFDLNWEKIAYDSSSNRFKRNEKTPVLFAKKLKSTPDNQFLMVEGKAKDQKGRSIADAQILLSLNGRVIDTLYSDKKGKYNMKLEYQKDYRMEVIKAGYQSTFAAVSTNTTKKEERLIGKKIKSFNLLLVNKNEKNINSKVFSKPYARVAYDADLDEFVEVNSVTNSFLADMYLEVPKEEKKKEYQLTATVINAPMTVANANDFKEPTTTAGASQALVKKRKQNRGQAEKLTLMSGFHNSISGIQNENRIKIKNVTLSLNEIFNARPVYSGQSQKEMDASIGEAAEVKNDFNNIISSALGMRTNADLVSTDSTFNVNLLPRIKHINQGAKIYTISRDQVFVNGTMTEYVETIDWFIWHTRFKDNKKISNSTYVNELDSIKNIGYLMN